MSAAPDETINIAVSSRGKRKFQFADGPEFEVDIFEASFRIQEIVEMFPNDGDLCKRYEAYREMLRTKYQAGEASFAEIYKFLEQIDELSVTVKKNSDEKSS